jgi:hypothetical protein
LASALHSVEPSEIPLAPTKPNPTKMKKILLTIALLGVALASTASAHPGGCHPCYHPSSCWYPTYNDCDDEDYCHPHRHHHSQVIIGLGF